MMFWKRKDLNDFDWIWMILKIILIDLKKFTHFWTILNNLFVWFCNHTCHSATKFAMRKMFSTSFKINFWIILNARNIQNWFRLILNVQNKFVTNLRKKLEPKGLWWTELESIWFCKWKWMHETLKVFEMGRVSVNNSNGRVFKVKEFYTIFIIKTVTEVMEIEKNIIWKFTQP